MNDVNVISHLALRTFETLCSSNDNDDKDEMCAMYQSLCVIVVAVVSYRTRSHVALFYINLPPNEPLQCSNYFLIFWHQNLHKSDMANFS